MLGTPARIRQVSLSVIGERGKTKVSGNLGGAADEIAEEQRGRPWLKADAPARIAKLLALQVTAHARDAAERVLLIADEWLTRGLSVGAQENPPVAVYLLIPDGRCGDGPKVRR